MNKVICEEAMAGRGVACPTESKPHEPTRLMIDGKDIVCTDSTKCWHIGAIVRCVPVEVSNV